MALNVKDIIKVELFTDNEDYQKITKSLDVEKNKEYVMESTRCNEMIVYNRDTEQIKVYYHFIRVC